MCILHIHVGIVASTGEAWEAENGVTGQSVTNATGIGHRPWGDWDDQRSDFMGEKSTQEATYNSPSGWLSQPCPPGRCSASRHLPPEQPPGIVFVVSFCLRAKVRS